MIPPIRYFCDLAETGYGCAARGYIQAMKTIGLTKENIRVIPAMMGPSMNDYSKDDVLYDYTFGEWNDDDKINIVHLNPALVGKYHTSLESRYNIAICAWETNQLPKTKYKDRGKERSVITDLNAFDEIWVPTKFVGEVMKKCGVEKPIFIIPHVIRQEIIDMPIKKRDNSTKKLGLYFIGSWNDKKNPEALLRAYWTSGWNILSPVQFVLHLVPTARDETNVARHSQLVKYHVDRLKDSVPDKSALPQFMQFTLPRTYQKLIEKVHLTNHVFITASHGEGACLPAMEAAALGNYVIGGGGPALEDLAEVAPGICTILPRKEIPITPMPECQGYEIDQTWWDVDSKDLKTEMKAIMEYAREEMPSEAEIRDVREFYSPKRIGAMIEKRLVHAAEVVANSGW